MVDLAVREDDLATADSLFARRFPDGRVPVSRRPILAAVRRDSAMLASVFAQARREPSQGVLEGARAIAVYFGDTGTADALSRTVLEADASRSLQAEAWQLRAEIALAEGRWEDVEHALARSAELGADDVPLRLALYASLPFLSLDSTRLSAIRSRLVGESSRRNAPAGSGGMEPALEAAVREYLLALLSARLKDPKGALAAASELERIRLGEDHVGIGRALSATVRADAAWRAGRPAEVLALVESVEARIPLPHLSSPYLAQEHTRFLRAEALAALGRPEEALRCFANCFSGTPTELAYLAPIHLRRGRALEQLGRTTEASAHYLWVERLWRNSDAGIRPQYAEAQGRLRAIAREAPPSARR